VPIDTQFQLSIGGIGGTTKVAGFFLDSMLLRTLQGNAANDNDPHHFRFLEAPVLVSDISVKTPDGSRTLTLDGIFGMNNLVASLFVDETGSNGGFPAFDLLTPGAFDWAVFDETTGELRLRPRLRGDANRDGVVDFNDLVVLAQNYNSEVSTDQWASGDFNGDGVVDFNDLVALAQNYNNPDAIDALLDLPHYNFDFGGFGAPVGASVPEPSTFGLLVACGMPPLLRRRRRPVQNRWRRA
jgi:Dockerin type I domain